MSEKELARKYESFTADYCSGVGKKELCEKYGVPSNRLYELVGFLRKKGYELKKPVKDISWTSEVFSEDKPASVKIIGWIFIIYSVFTLVMGAFGIVAMKVFNSLGQEFGGGAQGVPFTSVFDIYEQMGISVNMMIGFAVYMVVLNIAMFVSAVEFLRLKSWARKSLEVLSWIMIVQTIGTAVYFSLYADVMYGGFEFQGGQPMPPMPPVMDTMYSVITVISTIPWVVGLGVMIYFLRKKTVRDAMG